MNEQDILQQLDSIDLSTVPTGFPLLKTGVVTVTLNSIEFEPSDKDVPIAVVKMVLAQPWEDIDGKSVQPGFPLTDRIYLNPWTDPKTNEVKNFGIQRLATLREAVFGKAAPGTKFNKDELMGQTITVRLKYDPAPKNKKTGETYGPQTTVDAYVKKK